MTPTGVGAAGKYSIWRVLVIQAGAAADLGAVAGGRFGHPVQVVVPSGAVCPTTAQPTTSPSRKIRTSASGDRSAGPTGPGAVHLRGHSQVTVFEKQRAFRGKENRKFRFAVLAAAALCAGAEPDLPGEVAWWQTDDFWQYALFAAIAYIRIAADRASVPVHQVYQELTQRPDPRPD